MVRWLVISCALLLMQTEAFGRIRVADVAVWLPAPDFLALQASEPGETEREPGPADLDEATEIALKRYGGDVSRAATVVRDGRRVHEIRLLSEDGIVRTVRIDPQTGRIIPQERRQD